MLMCSRTVVRSCRWVCRQQGGRVGRKRLPPAGSPEVRGWSFDGAGGHGGASIEATCRPRDDAADDAAAPTSLLASGPARIPHMQPVFPMRYPTMRTGLGCTSVDGGPL